MIGFAEFSRRCNVSALLRYFADIIAYPAERLCRCVSRPPVAALVPRPRLNLIRYLGSFNFDPRSANLNTEMGVIIHDAKLGEFYASELESHYEEFAYVVFKDEKGKIRWLLIALRCRRMAETAAQPVDEILPRQPLRHRHAPDPHGGIYSQADAGNEREEGATPAQRMTWALRLRRVFRMPQGTLSWCFAWPRPASRPLRGLTFPIHLIDVGTCPKCGGAVKIMPKALAALAGQAAARVPQRDGGGLQHR